MFLPASLTKMTNDYVRSGPADSLPRFKRTGPHVAVGGSVLRYSSTTPNTWVPALERVAGRSTR